MAPFRLISEECSLPRIARYDVTDYINLLMASFLAAAGLATDSFTTVMGSILISPMMKPIMRIAVRLSSGKPPGKWASGELAVALLSCFVVGLAAGMVGCLVGTSSPELYAWPTAQMLERTEIIGRGPIFFAAIFSGIAAANTHASQAQGAGALVGVAISASLLPPVVNAGMLLGWAVFEREYEVEKVVCMASVSTTITLLNVVIIALFASAYFCFSPAAYSHPKLGVFSFIIFPLMMMVMRVWIFLESCTGSWHFGCDDAKFQRAHSMDEPMCSSAAGLGFVSLGLYLLIFAYGVMGEVRGSQVAVPRWAHVVCLLVVCLLVVDLILWFPLHLLGSPGVHERVGIVLFQVMPSFVWMPALLWSLWGMLRGKAGAGREPGMLPTILEASRHMSSLEAEAAVAAAADGKMVPFLAC